VYPEPEPVQGGEPGQAGSQARDRHEEHDSDSHAWPTCRAVQVFPAPEADPQGLVYLGPGRNHHRATTA
jgi:hypothetical protein